MCTSILPVHNTSVKLPSINIYSFAYVKLNILIVAGIRGTITYPMKYSKLENTLKARRMPIPDYALIPQSVSESKVHLCSV